MSDTHPCRGKRLLVAGGGTGGHIYPGLAVAAEWTNQGGTAAFVGVPGNLEARLAPAAGYGFFEVDVQGLTRGSSLQARLQLLRALLRLLTLAPLWQALNVIRQYRPDVVLGVGGYVSGPALLAAWICRVPTMILQLDARPGIANRVASFFVTRVGLTLAESEKQFHRREGVCLVGNPVRPEIVSTTREESLAALGLNPGRQTLLVFGGSLGSRAINEAVVGALRILGSRAGWGHRRQVIHLTGRAYPVTLPPEDARSMGLDYRAMEYSDRMPLALAAADLVVCRAGATTVAELTARGVPAILIPWAGAADNHQEGNARALERIGAARVILDQELTPERLAAAAGELLDDPSQLHSMAQASRSAGIPDAASRVVRELLSIATSART